MLDFPVDCTDVVDFGDSSGVIDTWDDKFVAFRSTSVDGLPSLDEFTTGQGCFGGDQGMVMPTLRDGRRENVGVDKASGSTGVKWQGVVAKSSQYSRALCQHNSGRLVCEETQARQGCR